MRPSILILTSAVALFSTAVQSGGQQGPITSSSKESTASTSAGKVIGYIDDGVYVFKGIPYAKAERFQAPEDPDPWEGIRPARHYGPACPQGSNAVWRWQNDNEFAYKYSKEVFDEKDMFV